VQITASSIIIREFKPGRIEIVCRKTGKARVVAKVNEPTMSLDMPIAEGYLPFGKRPIESLERLRELRTKVILDYRKAKVKDKRTKAKKPSKPRQSKLRTRIEEKLKNINPVVAALLRKELESG